MPSRAMRSGAHPAMSRPAKRTLPPLGARSPESRLISVVLPAPLGPISPWTPPPCRSSETSLTALRPPKRFDRSAILSAGSATARRRQPLQRAKLAAQAADAFGQQQHGEDDEEAHRQQPMPRQVAQHLLHQRQGEGAEHGAIERARAAQYHHHQHEAGEPPAEQVGIDYAELRGVEISGE